MNKEIELREIAKHLLNAYIDFTIENPSINMENERAIKITNGFEFLINTTMAEILNERYIKKYSIDSLRKAKEIADRISTTLMEKKLVTGSQISKVRSDYWWGGKIETKEEFKLEFRTRSDKINEIVEIIKSIHDYPVEEWHDDKVHKIRDSVLH